MFGGQTLVRTDTPWISPLEQTYNNAGVMEFIPHEDKFVDQNLIPTMEAPKARPLFVRFEDKIFVHDRYRAAYRGRPLHINCLFQSLSLSPASTWVTLDSPMAMGMFTGHRTSVVGERLFLLDQLEEQVVCFNLLNEKWEPDSSSSMVNTCRKNEIMVPIGATRVFRLPSGANILLSVSPDVKYVRALLARDYSTAEESPYRLRAYVLDESSLGGSFWPLNRYRNLILLSDPYFESGRHLSFWI